MVDETASKSAKKNRMTVQRGRFLPTTREDLTGEHDIGLILAYIRRGKQTIGRIQFISLILKHMDSDSSQAFY